MDLRVSTQPAVAVPLIRLGKCLAVLGVVTAAVLSGSAKSRTVSLSLKPRQPQTLRLAVPKDQVVLVHLHLNGGIIGIRETPGNSRPLWLIDLGQGGSLTYLVAGTASGVSAVQITSFERERDAEVALETDPAVARSSASTALLRAEDLLATAELLRRHWPGSPSGKNPLPSYDAALNLASSVNDVPLERLILTDHARYLIFHGKNYKEGQALLEKAVLLPSSGDASQQALAWKTLSSVRYDLGEYQPAIAAGQMALSLYRQTKDVYWQGVVLGNLASVYSELGQNADALTAARQALEDAEDQQDLAGVVYCLSQLADLYQQHGDLESALRTFHQGLAWISTIGYAPLVEAEIEKDLGGFYAQTGSWELANQALHRSLELEKGQDDPVSCEVHGLLAAIMQQQGRSNPALSEVSTAIAMARRLELKQDEADLLLKRASLELALHHPASANDDAVKASHIASQLASIPLQVETALELAQIQLNTSAGTDATAFYRAALRLAQKTGEREQQSVALAGLAEAFQQQGRLEDAANSIEAALKIVETSRGSLTERNLQVSYLSLHRQWYELAVDISMERDRVHPGNGYSAQAFAYTERARAQSLLDTLQSSGYNASIPESEGLREKFADNERDVTQAQETLTRQDSETVAGKLRELYQQRENLERQVSAADPRLDILLKRRTVDVSQAQRRLLDQHTVLLSYWVGEKHSYRWLLTRNNLSVRTLPPRPELEKMVLPLERMLRDRHPMPVEGEDIVAYAEQQKIFEAELQAGLDRAGPMLLAHIPQRTRTILLVGDGCLKELPFAALRVTEGRRYIYALLKYSIFMEPSTLAAISLRQDNAPPVQTARIVVFADPVFSPSDRRLRPILRKNNGDNHLPFANLTRLTSSIKEATYIAHVAPPGTITLRTGFDATPDQVRATSRQNAVILHFATHTFAVPSHPELTGIALSMWNREGKVQDGVFWLKDIYSLHLHSSLVVLSGCGTNRQNREGEEDLDNLSYAFFFAGAHSVVGSLWAVDDEETSVLMRDFYQNLLTEHQPADEALHNTQLQMLANPRTQSPAAWAPFVLEGMPLSYLPTNTAIAQTRFTRETK